MKYKNIREEELKNKVGVDFFSKFDHTEILGNIEPMPCSFSINDTLKIT